MPFVKSLIALSVLVTHPAFADEARENELRAQSYKKLLSALKLPETTKKIILDGQYEASGRHRGGACKLELNIGTNYLTTDPQLLSSLSDLFSFSRKRETSVSKTWGGNVEISTNYTYHSTRECNIFCSGTNVAGTVQEQLSIKLGNNGAPESFEHYRYQRTREMSWLGVVPMGIPMWERKSETIACKNLRVLTQ